MGEPALRPDEDSRRRVRRQRARARWLAVHRVIGLGAGLLFALIGLTGSALVFYLELDEWLHPSAAIHRPASAGVADAPAVALDELMRSVRSAHPQRTGPWRIELPLAADRPLRMRYYRPSERTERMFAPLLLVVNLHTQSIERAGFWGDDPLTWIYDLHYTLLLDRTGHTVVGLLGLLLATSLASGLYLWWPSRRRLAAALRPAVRRSPVRSIYDLHVLSGVYGGLLVAVLAVTGSLLALPSWVHPWLASPAPAVRAQPAEPSAAPLDAERPAAVSLDTLLQRASQHFPGADPRWIETAGANGGLVSIRLRQAFEPSRRFPRTQIWFDSRDGRVLRVRDARDDSPGEVLLAWLHPLHNGEAFGLAGRWAAFFSGLLPALLFGTGLTRWLHKRRARQ